MKTHLPILCALLFAGSFNLFAQTNPTPVTLPFSLTSQTGGTLPAGVAVHKFGSIQTTRTTSNATGDLGYNAGGATTNTGAWYGLGADGIGLLASSTNAAGAVIVSIVTTGLTNIGVSWQCKTVFQQASRDNSIALQYRIGTSGAFTDIGTTTTYTSAGKFVGDASGILTETLPVAAENQPEVQLRWVYWESAGSAGSRDKLTVTDISIAAGTLPVTLTRFDAVLNNTTTDLSWTTAQEINNSHFDVERSLNGKDFTVIGTVKGNGNYHGVLNYSFADASPAKNQINYYRLKQVDFDGKSEYSKTVTVSNRMLAFNDAAVYPNPVVNGESVLSYKINAVTNVTVSVYNSLGEQVYTLTKDAQETGLHSIQVPSLSKGIYLLKIVSGTQEQMIRLLAQ